MFRAQILTIGHSGTGECICTRREVRNPQCPVAGHTRGVTAVAISADGSRIVSGSFDNLLKIWNAVTGAEVSSFVGVCRVWWGYGIVYSRRSRLVLPWQSSEMRVGAWQVHTLTGHAGWVWCVAFSPNGSRVVSGYRDKSVKIWNVDTGVEVTQTPQQSHPLSPLHEPLHWRAKRDPNA